jgi:hypothetical protein
MGAAYESAGHVTNLGEPKTITANVVTVKLKLIAG